MTKTQEFFDLARSYIPGIIEEKSCIISAAVLMGDCMNNNGLVQLCGINHGLAFSMELGYRAGGLMPFHQFKIADLLMRKVITEVQYNDPEIDSDVTIAHKMLNMYNVYPQDMFIFASYPGNEPVVVELALVAKQKGQKIIAVVDRKLSDSSPALHSTGQKLTDLADVVLDVLAPYPDTVLTLSDGTKFGQVSTICGNILAQMLTAETYRYLKESGKPAPILLSANVKGADVHNRAISDMYLGRWNS